MNYYSEPIEDYKYTFEHFIWRCFKGQFLNYYSIACSDKIPLSIIIDNTVILEEIDLIQEEIIKLFETTDAELLEDINNMEAHYQSIMSDLVKDKKGLQYRHNLFCDKTIKLQEELVPFLFESPEFEPSINSILKFALDQIKQSYQFNGLEKQDFEEKPIKKQEIEYYRNEKLKNLTDKYIVLNQAMVDKKDFKDKTEALINGLRKIYEIPVDMRIDHIII